jgi:hypothetical protein
MGFQVNSFTGNIETGIFLRGSAAFHNLTETIVRQHGKQDHAPSAW